MARISNDNSSWHARSIERRDARHDLEYLSDEASNGKVRGRKRRRVKGCEHRFPETPTIPRWGRVYCTRCGKSKFFFNSAHRTTFASRYRDDPKRVNQRAVAKEKFFPVHDEGTCATCDERRRILEA